MHRRTWEDGVELVRDDLNAATSAIERGLYDNLLYQLVQRVENAFFGDSLKIGYSSPTQITVAAGLGFQTDSSQTNPEPTRRPIFNPTTAIVSINSPHASLNRIDIVCIKWNLEDDLTVSRKFKDADDDTVSTESAVVQKKWTYELLQVTGTPNASPAVPSTPAGYIKLAEILVTAVTGLSGSGAITDTRTLMPIAGEALYNTVGFSRLTAGTSTSMTTLLADIEELLANGIQGYTDFINQTGDPAAPGQLGGVDLIRTYWKAGAMWSRQGVAGTPAPLGGGGGGGGAGASWYPVSGGAPIAEEESGFEVYKFADGDDGKLVLWLKVPDSYISGRPITASIGCYSPSSSNTIKLKTTTTLIRKNQDAVTSSTNQHASTNAALTNTVANMFRQTSLDLTSSTGTVNSVAVTGGDLLKVELSRDYAVDTDTADVRFIPSATEFKFS